MKKLIKYILLVIIVVIAMPPKNSNLESVIKEFNIKDATSTFYSTVETQIDNATIIKNGNSVIYECNLKNSAEVKKQLKNIKGHSISFEADYNEYLTFKKNIFDKIYFTEELENIKICYGYNKKLTKMVNIDKYNVNIQMAYSNNKIIIGNPVILGSF